MPEPTTNPLASIQDLPLSLHYASGLPWYQPLRGRRGLRFAIVVALVGFAFGLIRSFVGNKAICEYWRIQARRYVAASATPVFSTDPQQMSSLLACGGKTVLNLCIRATGYCGPFGVAMRPKPWDKLHAYFSPGLEENECPVVLHERFTPAGKPLLMAIDVEHAGIGSSEVFFQFCMHRVEDSPHDGFNADLLLRRYRFPICGLTLVPSDHFTLFAGQPNPTDRSRFSIPYHLNGASGVISGRIVNESTSVLHVDSGPLVLRKLDSLSDPLP